MNNLFLAMTPYHVLVSYALAIEQSSDKNYLLVIREFEHADLFIQTMRTWPQSPFREIKSLPGAYVTRHRLLRQARIRRNILEIFTLLQKYKPKNVYVFNDARAESQAALEWSRKRYSSRGIYVEDGIAAYVSQKLRSKDRVKQLIEKMLYGTWRENVEVLGTSHWVDEVKVAFPHLVRPELQNKNVNSLPRERLLELANGEMLPLYLAKVGLSGEALSKCDGLLILRHSADVTKMSEYGHLVYRVLDAAKAYGLRLAVKYHPREKIADYLSMSTKDMVVIPRACAVETIYLIAKSMKYVIGDISTSLITAKWLLENCTVISLAQVLHCNDTNLIKTFCELNIIVPHSVTEVEQIFQI